MKVWSGICMEAGTIVAFLAMGSIIFIGFFGNSIFNKYRIPDVLILVFLGILLGPSMLGERYHLFTRAALAGLEPYKDLLLSAALVIVLFDGGLSLDIRAVFESMRLSAVMTVLTFVTTTTAIGAALSLIMGMDLIVALALGAIVGGTSGAVVIPIASRLRIRPQTKAIMIMESAMTDVLVIVVALALISVVKIGSLDVLRVSEQLAAKFLLGGVIGFLFGVLWLFVLQKLQKQPLSYMITIAALFLLAGATEMIGSSGGVAALAFGLSMGNRQFVRSKLTAVSLKVVPDAHIQQFHSEITFFVRTFFFVYLGLLFQVDTVSRTQLVAGLLMISVAALVRWFTSMAAWKVGSLEMEDAFALFGLMPRGLAAAVLATYPAVALIGVPVWEANPELATLFFNSTLIVILGTTIIATISSFVVEKNISRKELLSARKKRLAGDSEQ